MGAPPYWNRLQGRDLIGHLLGHVVDIVEDFTYHREWIDGRELALELEKAGKAGDLERLLTDLPELQARFDELKRSIDASSLLAENGDEEAGA